MSRSGDFRGDDDNRQTDYCTPAHARGITMKYLVYANHCVST